MNTWLKRSAFPVIAGCAVVISGAVNIGLSMHYGQQERQYEQAIQEARDDRSRAQQDVAAAQQEVTAGVFGAQPQRIEDDSDHLGSLFRTALTWDSHESYVNARHQLVDDFGLDRDSAFMSEFLISPDTLVTVDGEGNEYYGIDARGMNSSVENLTVSLLGVQGTTYRYQVTAEISVLGEIGQESARVNRPMLAFVDMGPDDEILSIEGYATQREMQTSG